MLFSLFFILIFFNFFNISTTDIGVAGGARPPAIEMLPMIKMSQKKTIVSSLLVFFSIFAYNSNQQQY